MRLALTFLTVTVGLALLAAIAAGVGLATGHIKHECVTSRPPNPFLPTSGVVKTCSWKVN